MTESRLRAKALLESANSNSKPNYTQYQLALMEVGAPPVAYRDLRLQMEARFSLPPLGELVYGTVDEAEEIHEGMSVSEAFHKLNVHMDGIFPEEVAPKDANPLHGMVAIPLTNAGVADKYLAACPADLFNKK